MSPAPPRRRVGPGGRPAAEPALSPEEVAAALAVVKALTEEETVASGAADRAAPDAWAASGRPGKAAAAGTRHPGPPARTREGV